MQPGYVGSRTSPMDFEQTGTRELVAEDFVYALKRHTTTRITTPIYGVFSEYVLGLAEYSDLIKKEDAKLRQGLDPASQDKPFLDFRPDLFGDDALGVFDRTEELSFLFLKGFQ